MTVLPFQCNETASLGRREVGGGRVGGVSWLVISFLSFVKHTHTCAHTRAHTQACSI